jgi:hypothetical protein
MAGGDAPSCNFAKDRPWSILLTIGKLMNWKLGGLKLAIERGWLTLDRFEAYVKFTQAGAEL